MSRHQGFQKEAPSLFKFSQLLGDSVMTPAGRYFQTWDRKSQRRGEVIVSENVLRTAEDLGGQSAAEASPLSCISALAGWLSWWSIVPVHQKVEGSIPSWGTYRRQPIDIALSHQCLSLSKNQ